MKLDLLAPEERKETRDLLPNQEFLVCLVSQAFRDQMGIGVKQDLPDL